MGCFCILSSYEAERENICIHEGLKKLVKTAFIILEVQVMCFPPHWPTCVASYVYHAYVVKKITVRADNN